MELEIITRLCFYTSLEVQQELVFFHQMFQPHWGGLNLQASVKA